MRSSTGLRFALVVLAALGASASTIDRAVAEDPADASGTRRCTVTGRIVDGWESGVAGAQVAWIADTPGGDRSTAGPVRTGDTGRFHLDVVGPADDALRGILYVTRGDDSAAYVPMVLGVGDRDEDVGPVWSRRARPVHVYARREGKPTPGAQVWLWAAGWHPNSRELAFVGTATTDATGRAELPALPTAHLTVYVSAPDGSVGGAIREVVPGNDPSRVTIELEASRAIDVLVTTDDSPGRPIAGATIVRRYGGSLGCCVVTSVAAHVPNRVAPTGGDGRTRVDGLRSDRFVELEARVDGHPKGFATCRIGETSATIVVPKATRIAVEGGERPTPRSGAKLVVAAGWSPYERQIGASMEKGAIVVPLVGRRTDRRLVIAPDGSFAPLENDEPARFFKPRSLAVRLVEKNGRGVAGAKVSLSTFARGAWEAPLRTDDEGRVRFEGLAPVKYAVHVEGDPHGYRLDEVDLAPGSATRDLVVAAETTLRVRVTIDGKPAFPERFYWRIPDALVVGPSIDRAAGTFLVRARPRDAASRSGSIEVEGTGVRSREISFPWAARGETSIEAALSASPEVVLDVRAAAESEVSVNVEEWSPSPWARGVEWFPLEGKAPHQAGRTSIELDAGRYRLRDAVTGVVSEAFDVPDRGEKVVARLDLTDLVTVRGRVELPDDAKAEDLELVIEGDGIDTQFGGYVPFGLRRGLSCDGTSFEVRVPAGKSFTFSPWHPSFWPARDAVVSLVGPRDDVVLKMGGVGATLVARLLDSSGEPLSAAELEGIRLSAATAARPDREAVVHGWKPVAGKPGTVIASGLPYGSLDVWISRGAHVLRRVRTALAADVTDVGDVRLTAGSRVSIRMTKGPGTALSVEEVKARALRMTGPKGYDLLESSDFDADVLAFRSLGEGRWHIEIEWVRKAADGPVPEKRTFEIDVDGEHEQTIHVDLEAPPAPAK